MMAQSVVLSTQMMQMAHSDIHSHHSLRGISGAFGIRFFGMKAAAPLKTPLTQHTYAVCLIRTSQNIHHNLTALRPPILSTEKTLPVSTYTTVTSVNS